MTRKRYGTVLKDVQTLFEAGAVGTSSDAELLGRFADRLDESAEASFAALVERHGPMVLRVCRSVLRDHQDAQDAFQATFLILVRRASAVRHRESVGSWLYGVALRVSVRAAPLSPVAGSTRPVRRRWQWRSRARSKPRSSSPRSSTKSWPGCRSIIARPSCSATWKARPARRPHANSAGRSARSRAGWRGAGHACSPGWSAAVSSPTSHRARGSSSAMLSAALANQTAQAMLRFAAGKPTAGLASPTALRWALTTSRTIQMTRFVMISTLLIAGLATTGAALVATQEPTPAGSAAPVKKAAQKSAPVAAAAPPPKVELISVRVVDLEGQGVPNVEVEVVDQRSTSDIRRYRSGAGGRFRFPADLHYGPIELQARPDDRTLGWATITDGRLWPPTDEHPVTLTLLPLNHRVEGSVVDSRGKPIRGVRISPDQIVHEDTNGHRNFPSLSAAVTDEVGRFAIDLPANTHVNLFHAYHPRYVGPWFHCGAGDRTIPPVTLFDAGGIAGTVIDSTSGKPVAAARVQAGFLEYGLGVPLWGGGGEVAECPARVRVRLDKDSAGRQDESRTLSGRIFDPAGRPIAAIRVSCIVMTPVASKTIAVAATDRLGVLRMKGLPKGPFLLSMDKDDYGSGWSNIPADAAEVELTLQRHPNAPE